jgi:hypothetical protein
MILFVYAIFLNFFSLLFYAFFTIHTKRLHIFMILTETDSIVMIVTYE